MQTISKTDLTVSDLCFGTCPNSLELPEKVLFRLLDRFCDAGGNFLDTANVYGKWEPYRDNLSEKRIGAWLRGRGEHVVVATKGAHYDVLSGTRVSRVTQADIRSDLEESLRTLGLETIDLYWLHRDDPQKPMEEILYWMEQLRQEGKLRWYGASNYTAARLDEAERCAQAHGYVGFSAVSNQWSLAEPNPGKNNNPDPTLVLAGQAEFQFHTRTKKTCIPYQSTARGWFAKRAAGLPVSAALAAAFNNAHNESVYQKLLDISKRRGLPVQTVLLQELRHQSFPVIPITSASNDTQMDTLLATMAAMEQDDSTI